MVLFTLFFSFGVWLLQQQSALPDFAWAWLLLGFPLLHPLSRWRERVRVAAMTRRCEASGAGMAASHPLPQSAGFASNVSRDVRVVERKSNFQHLIVRSIHTLLLAAFAFGLGFYHAAWQAEQRLAASLPDEWQGRDIEVIGVVAELPRSHEHGQRFNFAVEQILTPQAGVPQHIYLSTYYEKLLSRHRFDRKTKPLALKAGERWRLTLRLKQPHGTANPHGFDFEAWALENNLRAVGYVHKKGDNIRLDALADGLSFRIESWREAVRDKFNATLGGEPYLGVLSALAIGDQSSIPSAQWQVFTRTGVNHLMSI